MVCRIATSLLKQNLHVFAIIPHSLQNYCQLNMANRHALVLLMCAGLLLLALLTVLHINRNPGLIRIEGGGQSLVHVRGLEESSEKELLKSFELLSESLRRQRALIEELACRQGGIGARGGFCLTPENVDVGGNSWWDPKLAKNLEDLFAGQRVGDLGAGLGWYGRYWMRKTKPIFYYGKNVEASAFLETEAVKDIVGKPARVRSWMGYDGAGNVEVVTSRWVRFLDLTEDHNLPNKYDWVMSLEVGEHIPNPFEKIFVGNLARHACKGIVLSWAVEGQGGHHHVNNHNNDVVIEMLKSFGFDHDASTEERLRKDVALSYFSNTLMVFKRPRPLDHPKCNTDVAQS